MSMSADGRVPAGLVRRVLGAICRQGGADR